MQVNTVNRIENGTNFVTSETFAKLCDIFEVAPAIFFKNSSKSLSENDLNYIREIKQLLPLFNTNKLKEIYDILLAIKNNI